MALRHRTARIRDAVVWPMTTMETELRRIAATGTDPATIRTKLAVIEPLLGAGRNGSPSNRNFHGCSRTTSIKEVINVRGCAKKLKGLILKGAKQSSIDRATAKLVQLSYELHQPTILTLADVGWIAAHQCLRRTDRLDGPGLTQVLDMYIDAATAALALLRSPRIKTRLRAKVQFQTKPGRPCANAAAIVARVVYSIFESLTRRKPTITVNPGHVGCPASGQFLNVLTAALQHAEIKASPEAVAKAVLKAKRP